MSSVLPAIAARLTSAMPNVTIALARAPDRPDALLLVRTHAAGAPRDTNAGGRAILERHAVQVLARATSVDAAEALAWRAYHVLPARHLSATGGTIDWIIANHTPTLVSFDQNDRALVSVNFTLQRWGDLVAPDRVVHAAAGGVTTVGQPPSVT